jgi:poly(A) polymerase
MIEIPNDILTSTTYQGATAIVDRLRRNGFTAYIVGGAPRDLLLGCRPYDYDIATDARPPQIRDLFARTIAVGEQYGVMVVVLDAHSYEVATFRADDVYEDGRRPIAVHFSAPREDALRRDFTVNALMFDPVAREIIDYVGGRRDIEERRIRTVGDPEARFREDHLRLIRAVRFAARLDFEIEAQTRAAIPPLAHLVTRVSVERVADELVKILQGPRAGWALQTLSETGLLKHILPEAERMRGVAQPPNFHPEGDVFTHVCLMLELAEKPTVAVALALLLHDIAKPATQRHAPDRIRFDGHVELGAEMAADICRRLRLSRAIAERVEYLVANHLRIKDAPQMRPSRLKRFLREPGFAELMELFRLDTLGSHGDLETYEWVKRKSEEIPAEEIAPPPLLRGDDLIAMGYTPGPIFKEILTAVETAQLEGELHTPEEAREFVRRNYPSAS